MNNIKEKDDCYSSTLVIRNLASDDMRSYKLIVENVHGIDSLQVNLTIEGKKSIIPQNFIFLLKFNQQMYNFKAYSGLKREKGNFRDFQS